MHQKLSKSPITYVLAQVRFTNIEDISKYVPTLQDKIRDIFPHYKEINIKAVQLRENQPITSTLTHWHFMNKEKHTGIILGKQAITIHASYYDHFQYLLDSLEQVLIRSQDILKISLFTRLGLRYINLIEDGLPEVNQKLQGFQLTGKGFVDNQFLIKMETKQRSKNGILRVQSTRVKDEEATINEAKNIFVPPDLRDIAKLLSFEHYSRPKKEFLILDIDHFNDKENDFSVNEIIKGFSELQELVYQAFCQAVGEKNLNNWK